MNSNPDKDKDSDFRVLNKLIALQSMLHTFSNDKELSEFIIQTFIGIPEIEDCVICLRNCTGIKETYNSEFKTIKESLRNIPNDQDHFSISLSGLEKWNNYSIQTLERSFGYIFLNTNDFGSYKKYKHAIDNFINMISIDMERRWQKQQLISYKLYHEELVSKRNVELETEIIEHKKTEKELIKSENKFRVLYNNSPDMFFSVSPIDGSIILCNDTALRKTGYSREEIIGAPLFSLYHEDCMDDVKKTFQQFTKVGRVENVELFLKRKDGSKIDVSISVEAVRDEGGKILLSILSLRDITEARHIEEALYESEEKYRAIVENSHNAIYIYQGNKFIFVNNKLCELIGYTREEISEMVIWDLIHPDDRKRIHEYGKKRIVGEKAPDKYNAKVIVKNGDVRNCEFAVRVIRYSNEFAVLGTVHDITERMQANEKLSKSEEKFRFIADNSVDVIWQTDLRLRFTYLSPSLFNMAGFLPEEWIGSYLSQHVSVKEFYKIARIALNAIGDYKNFKFTIFESNFVKKNGVEIPVEIIGKILRNKKGLPIGLQGSAHDITNRKQAETELEFRNSIIDQERKMFITGPVVVFKWKNVKGWPVEYVSPNVEEVFGFSVEDFLSGIVSYEELIPFADVEDVTKLVKNTSDSGMSNFSHQPYRIVRKDKKVIWVDDHTTILRNKNGDITHYLGYVIDITERMQVEEAFKDSESKFKSLIEQSPFSTEIYNVNGDCLSLNKAWEDLWGLNPKDVIGVFNILKDKQLIEQGVVELFNKVVTTGEVVQIPDIEFSASKAIQKGNTRWLSTTIFPLISENTVKNVIVIHQDITEKKIVEARVKAERDKLITIFESMLDGAYIVSKYYDIQYVNPVVIKDFGLPGDNKCYKYFHDLDEPCSFCQNEEVFAGKIIQWEWTSTRNGKTYDLIDSPIINSDGSISKLEILRDISARKEAETELAKHRDHLEEMVHERTSKLEESLKEVERMNKLFIGREFRIKELRDKVKELNLKINSK